jgi:hypothetical protein
MVLQIKFSYLKICYELHYTYTLGNLLVKRYCFMLAKNLLLLKKTQIFEQKYQILSKN